jgi:hypothetical protein
MNAKGGFETRPYTIAPHRQFAQRISFAPRARPLSPDS